MLLGVYKINDMLSSGKNVPSYIHYGSQSYINYILLMIVRY